MYIMTLIIAIISSIVVDRASDKSGRPRVHQPIAGQFGQNDDSGGNTALPHRHTVHGCRHHHGRRRSVLARKRIDTIIHPN